LLRRAGGLGRDVSTGWRKRHGKSREKCLAAKKR
jgi:hypothetical protein